MCCGAGCHGTQDKYAFTAFERAFKDIGLPRAIRSDNGLKGRKIFSFSGAPTRAPPPRSLLRKGNRRQRP
jgi:hypothetical protein